MKRFLLSLLLLIPLSVPATPVEPPPASTPSFVCSVSITGNDTYCTGASTTLTANVTGQVGVLVTYQWRRNAINIAVNGTNSTYVASVAGTYSVVVAGVSCTPSVTSANFAVSESTLAAQAITGTGEFCAGSSTQLTANLSGGTAPYVYQWKRNGSNVGSNTSTHPANAAGSYTVEITDSRSCKVTSPARAVTQNPLPSANAGPGGTRTGTQTYSLAGVTTGSGGTGTLTYAWSTNPGGVTISPSASNATPVIGPFSQSTTVQLTVTDSKTCSASSSAAITYGACSVTASVSASSDVICTPGQTITLTATPGGGTPAYSFQWKLNGGNVGSNANTYTANAAGSYTVTITDSQGCAATSGAVVITISNLAAGVITGNGEFCQGGSSLLTANPSGGSGALSYQWKRDGNNVGGNTNTYTATAPGSYTVVVTDSKGCSVTSAAKGVIQNPVPVASAGPGAARSGTETYSLAGVTTASGGTPGYTYTWSTNPIVAGNGSTAAQPTFGPFSQNTTISLTVTDSKGCQASSQATVTFQPCTLTVAIAPTPTDVLCTPGASTTLVATPASGTPPYSYQWRNGGANIGGATNGNLVVSAAGAYSVVVTDSKGCVVTSSTINVTQSTLTAGAISGSGEFCQGGSTLLTANPTGGSGGLSYQWKRDGNNVGANANTYSANAPGSYTVVVTDSKGCSATSSAKVVTQNPVPTASAGPGGTRTGTDLYSLSGVTTASGGTPAYTYAWSTNPIVAGNGSTAAQPTFGPFSQNTTISLTLADSKGCQASSQATVTFQPCTLSVSVAPVSGQSDVLCTPTSTTTLIATPSNGTLPYSFQWKRNGGDLSGQNLGQLNVSTAGAYSVVVSDAKGCVVTSSTINVTQSTLAVNSISGPTEFCAGASFVLTANRTGGVGPFSYEWRRGSDVVGGDATLSANVAGSYTVKITESKGCAVTSPARSVAQNPVPTANAGPDVTKVCDETYAIPGTVASGGTPGYTYAWNTNPGVNGNGSNASNPVFGSFSQNTTLTLTVRDSKGCEASDNATVTKGENPLNVSISSPFTTICPNQSITFNSNVTGNQGGPNYQWQNNNNNIGGANGNGYNTGSAGNYRLVVRDDRGCQRESNTIGLNNSNLSASVSSSNIRIRDNTYGYCDGSFAKLVANGNGGAGSYTYRWAGGRLEGTTSAAVDAFAGIYTLTVKDAQGCEAKFGSDVEVQVFQLPKANAGPGIVLTGSELYDLSKVSGFAAASGGSGQGYQYLWTTAPTIPTAIPAVEKPVIGQFSRSTIVSLIVTDSRACRSDPDTATVTYLPCNLTSTIAGNAFVCNNNTTLLKANAANGWGDPKAYKNEWKLGAAVVPNRGDSLLILKGGLYTLTTTDTRGCFKTSTLQVAELPQLLVTISGTEVFCRGTNATLLATVPNGSPRYTFQWKNGSTVLNSDSARLVVASGGNFTVSVTDSKGCTGVVDKPYPVLEKGIDISALITVNGPTSVFAPNTVTLTGNTGTDYTYQWRKDGKDIVGATTLTYVVTAAKDPGTANYTLAVSRDGCQATSPPFQVSVIVPTAVAPLTRGEFSVKAFPSPTTGRMQVEVSLEKAQALSLELTDLSGRSLFTRQSPTVDTQHRAEFDLTGRTAGIYLLRVQAGTQQAVQKVLKVD